WTEKEGAGKIFAVAQQDNQLYIATGQGVMKLNETKNVFEFISEGTRQAWSFLHYGNTLLAGTQAGVFLVKNASLEYIKGTIGGFSLHIPKKFPDVVMAATIEGVNVVRYREKDNSWEFVGKIQNYTEETRSIADDEEGNIWLGSYYRGVFKLVYNDTTSLLKPIVVAYDTTHALPSMKENYTFNVGEKLVFSTINGIYEFDKAMQRFFPSNTLGEYLKGGKSRETRLFASEAGRYVWYRTGFSLGKIQLDTGESDTTVFMRLPRMEINTVYPEKSGDFIWIGGSEGLFKYHQRESFVRPHPFPFVRRLSLGDSTVFWGNFSSGTDSLGSIRTTLHQPAHLRWIFPYAFAAQSLQFHFAVPSFDNEEANQYRYFLEGNDKNWSDWTSETKKEYTNLWEGEYAFRLKARNVYGVESEEVVYRFRILPPWYRTIWAYLAYAMLAALFTYGMVKLNTIRLERANKRLEEIVNQRTAEIKEKNIILEQQKEEIMVQNEELHQQQEEIIAQRDYIEKQKEQLQEQHTRIVDS
ncbi:MAG: hypothetical protein NZ521_09465, partial [Flammeovirgaceae bacterium]|nr:hypothetical protein [Flammeovirgaceae bacterium]MDW8288447.1 triple tyrosine motif-containing protein [Flammeovirgaceae bacterium]